MSFLLDTNACIALLNGRSPAVRRRFEHQMEQGALIATSAIVTFELWYGVASSSRPQDNARRLAKFLAGPFELVNFDQQDAQRAAQIRTALKAAGTPIGPYDVLIAGQALRLGATLVTSNAREFDRVPGLTWEDWAA